MKKQIIINASKDRSRIAIVEDGELVELYVENPDNVRTLGNIYLGSVQKVMPAIRAAFVDVGQKQDCFLHFSDLTDNFPQLLSMTGVEVPGLDQPMLSLAPKKQVSDDDSEPDIEDKLEVEPDDDSDDDARSRPSRGRRSRGRGRGHRHSEEEEEQEEAGEERPRRLPMVIDLTAKPRRPAPTPAPAPVVEADDAAEEEEEAPAETAPAPPRTRGRRTRPAPEEAPEEAASTDAEPADAPDADAPEAEAPAPERPRRSRSRRTAAEEPVAEATEEPVAETAEEPAPPARRSRSRRAAAEADAPETAPDAATTPDEEAPAPARRSRSRRTTAEAPAAEAADETPDAETTDAASTSESASEDAPDAQAEARPRRSRSRRTREAADEAPAADAAAEAVTADAADDPEATSPEAAEAESDDTDTPRRPRRRRGGRGRGRRTDDAEDGADAGDTPASSADAAESPAEEARPRRSRGGRGRGRGATETDATNEPASEAIAETEEAPARSRRRSRADASDAPAEPTRGRGRSARTDSETEPAPRESRASDRGSSASGTRSQGSVPSNEQLLKRGTPVIVKITKEPISTKGSRASTDLSIAGRFLVLVPAADYVAVSKKIESAKERRRLRTLASSLKPEGFGVIVRTVAEGRDTKSLDTDMRLLVEKWRKIERKLAERPKPPVLLYEDVNMVSSIIRDLFSEDYDQIIVDDPRVFKNVQTYVRAIAPSMADNVRLHTSSTPVFRALALERQVEEAFSKRVNMKGGGYLYIETTEAMHVVDVNSGRAGRGKSQKDNLIAVNVEAAKEIAKQLRLRDLGGIIVVDFIDLRHESDRRKVTNALKEAFAKDRAVTKLLPMSDFGLVQITRQRLRPSITTAGQGEDGAADPAEAARLAGAAEIEQPERGYAAEAVAEPASERVAAPERATDVARASTPEALTAQLRAWLDTYRKNVDAAYKDRPVVVRVHPLFAAFLRRGFPSPLTRWRLTLRGITYRIEEDAAADPLAFDVRDEKSGRTLMKKYVA